MNNSHAERIELKVLRPYHQHNERLFNNLREAHDFAPKIAQQMAYEALLIEDRVSNWLSMAYSRKLKRGFLTLIMNH